MKNSWILGGLAALALAAAAVPAHARDYYRGRYPYRDRVVVVDRYYDRDCYDPYYGGSYYRDRPYYRDSYYRDRYYDRGYSRRRGSGVNIDIDINLGGRRRYW